MSKKTAPKKKKEAPAQPISKDGFQLPPMTLLATGGARRGSTEEELRDVAAELQGTLEDFGVMASVVGWVEGPTVTLFKVDLPSGVRVSKVTNLTDDIALALAAPGVRIFAPIPGTNYVGIEVPNRNRQTVYLPDVLAAAGPGPLQVAIGEDVEGHAIVHDLAKMPHVLIAGTTGSGKSVEVNSMIMSILMRATPAEVRFIMVDPKRVEFAPYEGIPHLYVPVVTECREASSALSWAVAEMERRLKMFSKCGVRNIITLQREGPGGPGRRRGRGEARSLPENPYGEPIPYIVIVIDELADLMMNVRQGGRVLHQPHRPARPRRRHPPHHRHPAPLHQRGHGPHQGEHHLPHRAYRGLAASTPASSSTPRAPRTSSAWGTCSWPSRSTPSPSASRAPTSPTTRSPPWWRT